VKSSLRAGKFLARLEAVCSFVHLSHQLSFFCFLVSGSFLSKAIDLQRRIQLVVLILPRYFLSVPLEKKKKKKPGGDESHSSDI